MNQNEPCLWDLGSFSDGNPEEENNLVAHVLTVQYVASR